MTSEHSSPAPDAVTPERQAILDDIEETREQLGQTVEALAAKADVKAQVQHKAAEAAGAARQQVQRVAAAAGAAAPAADRGRGRPRGGSPQLDPDPAPAALLGRPPPPVRPPARTGACPSSLRSRPPAP